MRRVLTITLIHLLCLKKISKLLVHLIYFLHFIIDHKFLSLHLVLLLSELLQFSICFLLFLLQDLILLCNSRPFPLDFRPLFLNLVPPIIDAFVHFVETQFLAHGARILRVYRVQDVFGVLLDRSIGEILRLRAEMLLPELLIAILLHGIDAI